MSQISKLRWIMSVHVRGRKLKGQKVGREITLPLKDCERFGIDVGDTLQIEIKNIAKSQEDDSLARTRPRVLDTHTSNARARAPIDETFTESIASSEAATRDE